jgi:Quinolinate phosphoribosyl transferase, N-terminal domain
MTFTTLAFELANFDLPGFIASTLAEDLGPTACDVTSQSVIPADARFSGVMDSRDAIIVAGLPIAAAFFQHLDSAMEIEILAQEGASVPKGSDLMRLSGNARAMLTAERAQHGPAPLRHRDDDEALCRGYRGHGLHPARYAQDHPRAARAGEICHADGRRDQPPHGALGCGDDQG